MKIDYLSISFYDMWQHFAIEFTSNPAQALRGVVPPELMPVSIEDGEPLFQRPYPHGIAFNNGLKVLWGNSDTVLVSLSGRACNAIDCIAYLKSIPAKTHRLQLLNVSRLDIAYDIETDKQPDELVRGWGVNGRITTRDTRRTQTGHTEYIGSKKSDRFVRVYRYFEPHPRHATARVEFEYHKKVANQIANDLVADKTDIRSVFVATWNRTFKVPHATSATKPATVTAYSERTNSGTVVWFYRQVAPALQRLVAEGELSLSDVVRAITEKQKSMPDESGGRLNGTSETPHTAKP
jgi:DNA relaxase NicK